MAAELDTVTNADGGVDLVGTVDGVQLVFATVNASQVAAAHSLVAAPEPAPAVDSVPAGDAGSPAQDPTQPDPTASPATAPETV